MKKKMLAVILALVMAFSIAACGSSSDGVTDAADNAGAEGEVTVAGEDAVYPEETVLIGVELYDPTEAETLAMQSYFSYLQEHFNVEFKYSEAIADADAEITFIEDCAMAGCKAFFGYYNVTEAEQIRTVIDYEMYYYGYVNDEVHDEYKDNDYYLGMITGGGSEYDAGASLGQWVVDNGYTDVIYANGGADFGVNQFVQRQGGFMDTIGDDVEVTVVSGFPGDQFFADQASALAKDEVQAVVASFNGLDFWVQPIASAGRDDIELATIFALNEECVNAFNNGSLSFAVLNNIETYGFIVPVFCNAIDGNADALQENGEAMYYSASSLLVDSPETCQALYDVMESEHIFDAGTLKSIVVKLNSDADVEILKEAIAKGNQDEILK